MTSNEIFSLKNKLIIVTGASSGIGRATSILCSRLGARVILIARNKERLAHVYKELSGEGHHVISFDVTELSTIPDIVQEIKLKSGKIDGFVHSAGISITLPLRANKPEKLMKIFTVNTGSAFEFVRILSKKKYSNDSASFVLLSSIMGVVGEIGLSSYCASKGALISGTKALALELAARKQRINCVSPAMVETEMLTKEFSVLTEEQIQSKVARHPLGFGSPEDVANSIVFLFSDSSKWITGTNLVVDGGFSAR